MKGAAHMTGMDKKTPQPRRGQTKKPGNKGQFDERELLDGDGSGLRPETSGPYAGLPVTEIDKELAGYHGELYEVQSKIWDDSDLIYEATVRRENPQRYRYDGRFSAWKYTDAEVAKAEARLVVNKEIAKEIQAKIDPIDDEFKARGGWTRFFLVTSSTGGHVHRSVSCSTLRPRTRLVWLTDESGKTEAEIVERAGDGACTVCYPTAPVADKKNPRPNPFEDPVVKANREVIAADKAAKAAEKAKKAITMPDGKPVLDDDGRPLPTEIGAERSAMENISSIGWYDQHPSEPKWLAAAARVQIALAAKRGVSVGDIQDSWKKKMVAKAKRDSLSSAQVRRTDAALDNVAKIVAGWDTE